MDDIDRLNDRDEVLMAALRGYRKPTEPNTGRCHNCDEHISEGAYCDSDCRADHEQRQRFQARAPA